MKALSWYVCHELPFGAVHIQRFQSKSIAITYCYKGFRVLSLPKQFQFLSQLGELVHTWLPNDSVQNYLLPSFKPSHWNLMEKPVNSELGLLTLSGASLSSNLKKIMIILAPNMSCSCLEWQRSWWSEHTGSSRCQFQHSDIVTLSTPCPPNKTNGLLK